MEKNFKRMLSLLVAVFMVVSMLPASVFAADESADEGGAEGTFPAYIGETGYETLDAAIVAANAMTGDVTINIYGKLDYTDASPSLGGKCASISFVGAADDAEICITRNGSNGYISGTGSAPAVSFADLILSKAAGSYAGDAGFMNCCFTVYRVASVTYTNCTFPNGAAASGCTTTYTGCTFGKSYDKYAMWAYGNADIVVEDCVFDCDRGVKMYAEGAAKTTDLTVIDSDFSQLTGKPAIVLTYGESVTLDGNTYSNTGVFELDLDGAPNGTALTADAEELAKITAKNDKGACGVLVDGKLYTTVAQAAEAADEGSTVTLLHDSAETVELAAGVTLNTNGHTAENVTVATSVQGVTTADELKAALNAGGQIVMQADITIEDGAYPKVSADTVLDLNGHTFTLAKMWFDVTATLTVKDSVGGGQIVTKSLTDPSCYGSIDLCGGVFVLESGAVDYVNIYNDNSTITVNGGTLAAIGVDEHNVTDLSTVTLNFDPSSCLSEKYLSVDNGDGTFGIRENLDYGKVAMIGETVYETFMDAMWAAAPTDTVVVLKDVTEKITRLCGNIVSGVDGGVTVTSTYDNWVNCRDNFSIGENVTFKADYIFVYCEDGVVNGTLDVGQQYYQRYAKSKLTINAPGSMVIRGENAILRYMDGDAEAGIYINGDNDDSTVELKAPYISFYQGLISAKDATIELGTLWQTNTTDNEGTAILKLDNSKLTQTTNELNFVVDGNSAVELTNGSTMTIVGNYEVADSVSVTVDQSSAIIAKNMVASVNGTPYATLQAAIDAAEAGQTVTVLADIELTEGIVVAADKTITLDLNGKTITGTPAEAAAYAVILNRGDLTVTGDGKIICNHTLAGSTAYAVNTITNTGSLTIDGAVIENISTASSQIGYAIDNNSTSANAILVVKDGEIKASGSYYYDGIRQFCNNMTLENTVTVEGGSVSSIWLQNPSDGTDRNTKDVKGSVTISGGTVNNLYLEPSTGFTAAVSGGNIGGISCFEQAEGRDLTGFVTGGTFATAISEEFLAEDFVLAKTPNGTYGVGTMPDATVSDLGRITVEDYDIYNGSSLSQGGDPIVLQLAMEFVANDTEEEARQNVFAEHTTDFFIQINGIEGDSFVADGCYLAGNYGTFGWIMIPLDGMTIEEGVIYPVISSVGFDFSYVDICTSVKDFKCGIYFTPEVLNNNPDMTVGLTLGLSESLEAAQSATFVEVDDYTYTVEDLKRGEPVAQIGTTTYTSLQDAIDAAEAGQTITVVKDIELTEGLTVAADKTITLDLNGKTVSMEVTDQITASNQLILNKGDLTITDSSAEQTGKISYYFNGTADRAWAYAVTAISNQQGTLTIAGGTIESLSTATNVYKFTVDNLTNGNGGDATVNVTGGTITAAKGGSIRGFANSTTNTCTINIAGGDILGQVWLQDPNVKANKGNMTITGGTITANAEGVDAVYLYGLGDASGMTVSLGGDVIVNGTTYITSVDTTAAFDVEITGGTYNDEVWTCTWLDGTDTAVPAISGGTFMQAVPEEYCADGYIPVDNGNGTYGVMEMPDGTVAWNLQTRTMYTSVDQALAEVQAGQTVQLLTDCATTGMYVVIGADVTLDLNGCQLTVANYLMTVSGTSYIIDNTNGDGLLKVDPVKLIIGVDYTADGVASLPVWIEEDGGYRISRLTLSPAVINDNSVAGKAKVGFYFSNSDAYVIGEELKDGKQDNDGLQMAIRVRYTNSKGSRQLTDIVITDEKMQEYGNVWNRGAVLVTINGLSNLQDVQFEIVVSCGNIEIASEPIDYVANS